MARMSYLPMFLVAALAFGWATNVSAGDYDASVTREQTGSIPDFPHRPCNTSNGAYRLAPVWRPMGGSRYCFNIEVRLDPESCSGTCCTAGLHKIEFDVSSSCAVAGASVSATLNGVSTRVSPAYDKPPLGPVGSTVLRITQLGLDPVTAQGAELCITLKPNRGRQGCTTLEQLCSVPGFPAGTCTAATFDAACDCCPISHVVQAQPPPPPSPSPPPPPSPSPPPPPSPSPPPFDNGNRDCDNVCFYAKLVPPDPDVRPFRYNAAACANIQKNFSNSINSALNALSIKIKSPFALNATLCESTQVKVCGAFDGSEFNPLIQLNNTMQDMLPDLLNAAVGGDICRPQLKGYSVVVETADNQCLAFSQSISCTLPPSPFPNCTCNTTQGVLPFVVSPTYYSRASPFFGNSTTEYCFTTNTVPVAVQSTCYKANDNLTKIEWYANDTLRSAVKGYTITPAGGQNKKVASSWGALGTNALKVGLNWNDQQANGGLVCVAVQKPYTMQNLCLGEVDQCYARTFNQDSQDYCCPFFLASIP